MAPPVGSRAHQSGIGGWMHACVGPCPLFVVHWTTRTRHTHTTRRNGIIRTTGLDDCTTAPSMSTQVFEAMRRRLQAEERGASPSKRQLRLAAAVQGALSDCFYRDGLCPATRRGDGSPMVDITEVGWVFTSWVQWLVHPQ